MAWTYNPNEFDPNVSFEVVPVGDHRVRIEEVEQQVSKTSGNEMLKVTFSISGHTGKLWYYIVFMPDKPQLTNQKLGEFFDSFGIKPGDMNILEWRGKVGACRIKHEIYEGKTQARISYLLLKSKQGDLPAWQETDGKITEQPQPVQSLRDDGLDANGNFSAF